MRLKTRPLPSKKDISDRHVDEGPRDSLYDGNSRKIRIYGLMINAKSFVFLMTHIHKKRVSPAFIKIKPNFFL